MQFKLLAVHVQNAPHLNVNFELYGTIPGGGWRVAGEVAGGEVTWRGRTGDPQFRLYLTRHRNQRRRNTWLPPLSTWAGVTMHELR